MTEDLTESTEESKKPNRKPILIFVLIFLVLFFLYYKEFAKEHARLYEESRVKALKANAEAEECLAERAMREAEEARQKRLAAEAAEQERVKIIQIQVLKDYYKAVNEHDCRTAIQLRTNYSEKECEKIRSTRFNGAKIVKQTPNHAVAYLKIAYRQKGDRTKYHFAGYVHMGKQDGEWVIVGNFSSKVSLKEYIKKYNIAD
jgi:hypothetical protein